MRKLLFAVSLFALAGCQKKATPPPAPPKAPEVNKISVAQMPEGHPSLPSLTVQSRGPRRLSVDQLEKALDQIGNVPAGTVKLPADMAFTLGRPDYKRVTQEQLDPSPLFMKFMVDLGGAFCTNIAMAEAGRPADQRVFTRYATIDENLSYMLLRFTGIDGDDATPYLPRLKAAYDAGSQSPSVTLGGYQAVCMALFTSPEFLLY